MLDRALTFANPKVVSILKKNFVPVAIDQAYQRRQKDAEGDFYRKIASQGPRKPGRGTTQGLYCAAADGRFLGFSNHRAAERIERLRNGAIEKHTPAKVSKIEPGKLDRRYNPTPPTGGLVLRVNTKVLGGYEPTNDEYRIAFQSGLGRDNLWIRADEHQALVSGKLPKTLLTRIAKYHLVDNTRGEPPMWDAKEIRKLDVTITNGQVRGNIQLATNDKSRSYDVALRGVVEVKAGKVSRFDLVARGQFEGEGRYTGGAPKGDFPLAIAMRIADNTDMADKIPPQGSRGWVDGYLR